MGKQYKKVMTFKMPSLAYLACLAVKGDANRKKKSLVNPVFDTVGLVSQFTTSKFTILTNFRFYIYFLKIPNLRTLKKSLSQFVVFPNNDTVNWDGRNI